MSTETHIVQERVDGSASTNGEAGWLVSKVPPTDPALLAIYNATWQVETIILDSNWTGPVFEGGVAKLSHYTENGRPMFACLEQVADDQK